MRFKTLPVADLSIDKRYQRELDKHRVEKIAREFDPRQLGVLEVSARAKGKAVVFDGQHRLAALKKLHIKEAPCLVHERLTPEQEADLFVALQVNRRGVRPVERFRARVFAGELEANAIKEIVDGAGFSIARNEGSKRSAKAIQAVSTLEKIYRQGGETGLADTLNAAGVWNGDPETTNSMLLSGMFTFLSGYGERVDDEAMKNLAAVSPSVILRRAKGEMVVEGGGASKTRAAAVAKQLVKVAALRGKPTKRSYFAEVIA